MTFMVRANHTIVSSFPTTDRAAYLPTFTSAELVDTGPGPYVELLFNTDGTWECYGSNPSLLSPQSGTWLTGTGTSSDYYIRVNFADYSQAAGTLSGSSTDTWISLASAQSWRVTQTLSHDPALKYGGYFTVYINYVTSFTPPVLASGTFVMFTSKVPQFRNG
jgi:hypothetical protein